MQKLELEVSNDTNSKASLCQWCITKLNVVVIVKSVNKTPIAVDGIVGAIHEVAGTWLVEGCQKLNVCKTGGCKVTLGYKLPAKYVFYTVRVRDKNDYKLNE